MQKTFLIAALAVGMCLPAYAEQFTNDDNQRYDGPVFMDEEKEDAVNTVVEPKKSAEMQKEADNPVPINMSAEHAEYDSVSGDFHVSGNVVITQGTEKLLTTYAVGNMKTGDAISSICFLIFCMNRRR